MSNIDFTQVITADDKAAEAEGARTEAIKAACTARIYAVSDAHSQMNLAAAAAAGMLSAGDLTTYQAGLVWVAAMRAACMELIGNPMADYLSDTAWPDAPADVILLAAQF